MGHLPNPDDCLVGGKPTPRKNMSSSVGMMKFPTEWNNKSHVPNHQPVVPLLIPLLTPSLTSINHLYIHIYISISY